jgi:hypothetical protein
VLRDTTTITPAMVPPPASGPCGATISSRYTLRTTDLIVPLGRRDDPLARTTARDQVSAVGEEDCSGLGEATRERDRLLLAEFGFAAAAFPPSAVRDFEAERDRRFLAGVAATASLATSADPDAARDRLRAGVASEP